MLRLTGEKADGWVPPLRQGIAPADLGELDKRVTEAAVAAEHGADTFVLWPDGEDQEGQVERFAAEVAPAVRDAIGETT